MTQEQQSLRDAFNALFAGTHVLDEWAQRPASFEMFQAGVKWAWSHPKQEQKEAA